MVGQPVFQPLLVQVEAEACPPSGIHLESGSMFPLWRPPHHKKEDVLVVVREHHAHEQPQGRRSSRGLAAHAFVSDFGGFVHTDGWTVH